ncbi:MAG: hypothetical protein ABI867_36405 [Kofleriaceae bacterium]
MRAMIFVLAACAHGTGTGGGDGAATFKILYPDSPYKTRVGKKLYVKPVGQCVYTNGRDARWSMTGARFEGEVPGFVIEDGVISGTPKHAGSWTLHVKFSGVLCAGQAHDPQVVDVTITAS